MRISVIGTGYVGLVTGSCFAEIGNTVTCVDNVEWKVRELKKGKSPIFEPGLEEIIRRNQGKRLFFTTDLAHAVRESDFIFIAVGTPPKPNGEADISNVQTVARGIAKAMNGPKIIINKSTVPIGMGDLVADILVQDGPTGMSFDVVSNPEFLREGSAVQDLLKPDRVVIGATRRAAAEKVAEIYKPLNCPIVITDLKSAEMIKYASNAFLATKISFINEVANLCDKVGADVADVVRGMSLDPRIGGQFFSPGVGFGGSCFPKDVSALVHIGKRHGYPFRILPGVLSTNQCQRTLYLEKVRKAVGKLKGKTLAVWGLAFKPNTDDLREAPAITIVNSLTAKGARVRVFDPVVDEKRSGGAFPKAKFCRTAFDAARGADALLLLTEWNEFREIDLRQLKRIMKNPVILDGRNIYDPAMVRDMGFTYQGMGR